MSFKQKGNSKTPGWFPSALKKEKDLSHHKDGNCANFDVIKVNNYGKRQQRTLAVSQYGVSNLNGPTCQWFVNNSDVYSIVQDDENLCKFTLTFLHRYHFEAESADQARSIIQDFKKYNVGISHYISDNDSSFSSNGSSKDGSLKDSNRDKEPRGGGASADKDKEKKNKKDKKKEKEKEKEKERERQFLLQTQNQSLNNYNKLWQSSNNNSYSGGNNSNLGKSQNVLIEKKLNNEITMGLSPFTPTQSALASSTSQIPNTPNTFSVEGARVWKIRAEELKQQFQQQKNNQQQNIIQSPNPNNNNNNNNSNSYTSSNVSNSPSNSEIIEKQFNNLDSQDDDKSNNRTVEMKIDLQQITDTLDDNTKEVKKNSRKMTIDDFDLIKVLGVGSFGRVFLVRRKKTSKLYAMKVLSKKDILKKKQIAHTNTEKMVLSTMDHPFIVRLHYAFQSDDFLFLCMDYIPGGELFHHLQKAGKFPEELAKFYIAEVISALHYLHSNDIIYRDIKPENILLDEDGHIKLTDFGLSKSGITSAVGKQEGQFATTFCGTPEYLAPEIIQSKGHGKAVDWWGVGVLLYEILAGRSPFICSNRNDMYKSMIQGNLRIPMFLSPEAQDLLEKLLVPDPSKRLGSNGSEEIMNHPFFELIPWRMLESKMIKPPFKPTINIINTSQLSNDPDLNPKLNFQKRMSATSSSLFMMEASAFKNFSWNNEENDENGILAEKTSIESYSSSTPPSPTNTLRTSSRRSTLRNISGRKSSV